MKFNLTKFHTSAVLYTTLKSYGNKRDITTEQLTFFFSLNTVYSVFLLVEIRLNDEIIHLSISPLQKMLLFIHNLLSLKN